MARAVPRVLRAAPAENEWIVIPSPQARTLADVVDAVAPGVSWTRLIEWPPDVIAVVSALLAESGAYRVVVSPPQGESWPPAQPPAGADWETDVQALGQRWAAWVQAPLGSGRPARPHILRQIAGRLRQRMNVPLNELSQRGNWQIVCDLIRLLAMADEACAGIAVPTRAVQPQFHFTAWRLLGQTHSLSRLPRDRVHVIPKLRAPESGITVRSLTRHVAALQSTEVTPGWFEAVDRDEAGRDHATFLLVPWPPRLQPADFKRVVAHPLNNMRKDSYGFFEFSSNLEIYPQSIVDLVLRTQERVGQVDAVVLPESVLTPAEVLKLRRALRACGSPLLISGVRQRAGGGREFGSNIAYVGGGASKQHVYVKQYKHHRWYLDRSQIEQYHLGPALDPIRSWWEAIDVSARTLTFLMLREWLTLCPLVCEDLARPDPVAELLRAVGPSLVIALLLDGPQLAARWPGRYATALADDPGSAVLTLSSLGMVNRSLPAGAERSRAVALWKQRGSAAREIALDPAAEAIALTVSFVSRQGTTADGRTETETETKDVILSGIEQIP